MLLQMWCCPNDIVPEVIWFVQIQLSKPVITFFFCKLTLILQSFSNCVVMNVTFIMLRNVESAMYLFHFLLLL